MRRLLMTLPAGLAVLLAVIVFRTVTFKPQQVTVGPATPLAVDAEQAADWLAGAVTYPTISTAPGVVDGAAFDGLYRYLEATFPAAFAALEATTFSRHSRMLFWRGSSPEPAVLLAAHLDVVPADQDSLDAWIQPPFAGVVADGYIWGRGTLDDKGNVVAMLAAIDRLATDGYRPHRSLLLAFGHDEEVGGEQGAAKMAGYLKDNKIGLYAALDEGLAVTEGLVPGVAQPVAMIGVSERGYLSLRLTARADGGHSSMPPSETAVGKLAAAIQHLEARPFPARLDGPAGAFFEWVGPHMASPMARAVMANLWLFEPLLIRQLSQIPSTNALIRTTAAPTMLRAGIKENVLPTRAEAVVNLRLAPGDTIEAVIAGVRARIGDPAIEIEQIGGFGTEASPVAPLDGEPFKKLHYTIKQVFPDALVAPSLVVGATDARYYTQVTPHVFRFSPMRIGPDDLPRIHGINERIGIENFADMIRFYHRLIVNFTG